MKISVFRYLLLFGELMMQPWMEIKIVTEILTGKTPLKVIQQMVSELLHFNNSIDFSLEMNEVKVVYQLRRP